MSDNRNNSTSATIQAERNARSIALELIQRGVTTSTTLSIVRKHLISYASDSIVEFGVLYEEIRSLGDAVIESVMDGYEDIILPFIEIELDVHVNSCRTSSASSGSSDRSEISHKLARY